MSEKHDELTQGTNGAVARQVKAEAAAQGLTNAELSERSGIPERTLYRYLQCQRAISLETLDLIAIGLGVTPQVILRRAWDRVSEK